MFKPENKLGDLGKPPVNKEALAALDAAMARKLAAEDEATQGEIVNAEGLQRLMQLRLERQVIIDKWQGKTDRTNPEYLADMKKLKGVIEEIVRLQEETGDAGSTEEAVPEEKPFPTITPSE